MTSFSVWICLSVVLVAFVVGSNMPGGLSDVDQSQKDMTAQLHFATVTLNQRSNRAKVMKIYRINSIQQQVVAGVLYHVKAVMRPTVCAKNENNLAAEQIENCQFDNATRAGEECQFKIWERVWEDPSLKLVDPKCVTYTLAEGE